MSSDLNNLLLHHATRAQLGYVLQNPPHAILIARPAGSGKSTLGKTLAKELLEIPAGKELELFPHFFYIKRLNDKQDIAIEQIRDIIGALKLKVPGQQKVQRVVFIEDANFMSIAAQNALLKILEEPPAGVVILLSSTSVQNVLPTIASRAQILNVRPPGLKEALEYWEGQYPASLIGSAWRLSGGLVGLTQALLSEDQQHPLKEAVTLARSYLSAKTYERLTIIDSVSKNKEQLAYFLDALSRILSFLHRSALDSHRVKQATALLKSRQQLQKSQKALATNTNSKILALNLTLNLKV